jgi:hypothetical protein
LDTLVIHFSNEEGDGFFSEMTAGAPWLSGAAARLCIEHQQMLHDAAELYRFAAVGSPSVSWWRELQSRCHEFYKRLMSHECEENKLLHEARKVDVCVCN